jgi:uncharacterized protein (DUF302 family)
MAFQPSVGAHRAQAIEKSQPGRKFSAVFTDTKESFMTDMAFEVTISAPYDEALDRVVQALQDEGFGVLTRIDVHDTLKTKLDVDFRNYSILGACNPPLAHKALSNRPDAGLMLPCNVIVEETGESRTLVRIVDPHAMMEAGGLAGDTVMEEVGGEAGARLRRVAAALGA